MADPSQDHTLIDSIYDAAASPGRWDRAVAAMVEAAGCRTGIFYEYDATTQRSRPFGSFRLNFELLRDYERYYSKLDPWNRRYLAWPAGTMAPTYSLISDADFRRCEFYQDNLRHTGMFYGLGGVVDRTPGRMTLFGLQIAHEDGRFSDRSCALMARLMPHLRQASRVNRAIGERRREEESLEQTLHALLQPILIVDSDAKPAFANQAAEKLLRQSDGLTIRNGKIAAVHRGDQSAFRAALRPGTALDRPALALTLQRPRSSAHSFTTLTVLVVPLLRENRKEWTDRLALIVELPEAGRNDVERLAPAFGLSPAETRLWAGLARGLRLADIAEAHAVSVHTLRAQLLSLFRKLGVHRQADLVRMAGTLRPPEDEN
jgi:DNA-binding CsgD family transcriptional regulator/PAS domain-containing protein